MEDGTANEEAEAEDKRGADGVEDRKRIEDGKTDADKEDEDRTKS